MERLNTNAWRSLVESCSNPFGQLNEDQPNVPPPPPMPPGYPGGQDAWDADYLANVTQNEFGQWTWNFYIFIGGQWAITTPPPPSQDDTQSFSAQQYKAKRNRPTLNPPGQGGGFPGGGGMP